MALEKDMETHILGFFDAAREAGYTRDQGIMAFIALTIPNYSMSKDGLYLAKKYYKDMVDTAFKLYEEHFDASKNCLVGLKNDGTVVELDEDGNEVKK